MCQASVCSAERPFRLTGKQNPALPHPPNESQKKKKKNPLFLTSSRKRNYCLWLRTTHTILALMAPILIAQITISSKFSTVSWFLKFAVKLAP